MTYPHHTLRISVDTDWVDVKIICEGDPADRECATRVPYSGDGNCRCMDRPEGGCLMCAKGDHENCMAMPGYVEDLDYLCKTDAGPECYFEQLIENVGWEEVIRVDGPPIILACPIGVDVEDGVVSVEAFHGDAEEPYVYDEGMEPF